MALELAERLEAHRDEIEQALLTRVCSIEDPTPIRDPDYLRGLNGAVHAGAAYGLAAVGAGRDGLASIPPELLAQARRAAFAGVGLDTILRRYVAGHTLLDHFIAREADAMDGGHVLGRQALRTQAALLDRLIGAVAAEYNAERVAQARSSRRHPIECVRRLLDGELVDAGELAYDLSVWHVGVVATGPGAETALRRLAGRLDRRLLAVPVADDLVWAWLGGLRRPNLEQMEPSGADELDTGVCVGVGEPARSLDGWRLTHRQAVAALPVARRRPGALTRYGEVALLASMLQDEVLVKSLECLYLAPLTAERDGGESLRKTLRAYFDADLNSSSASAALGITRQTVNNRLRVVERLIGRPLRACGTEVKAALRLEKYRSDGGDFPVWQNRNRPIGQIE